MMLWVPAVAKIARPSANCSIRTKRGTRLIPLPKLSNAHRYVDEPAPMNDFREAEGRAYRFWRRAMPTDQQYGASIRNETTLFANWPPNPPRSATENGARRAETFGRVLCGSDTLSTTRGRAQELGRLSLLF
jgi:hypothetical protein